MAETSIYDTLDRSLYKIGSQDSIFNAESTDLRGNLIVPNSLTNSRTDSSNRVYDAIVDAAGRADYSTIEEAVAHVQDDIGGGRIFVLAGTYTPVKSITINTSLSIEGESENLTIIDFGSSTKNFVVAGTVVSTTGTITTISGGVNVTGSGTSWLSTIAAGQHLFLGTRWYLIAAVTGDTSLVLAEAYGDDLTLPVNVRIATVTRDVDFKGMQIKNSTNTAGAIDVDDCRNVTFGNLLFLSNYIAFTFTKLSEFKIDTDTVVGCTSDGYQMTDCGLGDIGTLSSVGNGGNGGTLNNLKIVPFTFCASSSNTGDGLNLTSVVKCYFKVELTSNGGQGIELVSGCNFNEIDVVAASNTSDNVKLTATSDSNIIRGIIVSSGAYGINIAASSCDTNIIRAPSFGGNTSGNINDSGTGTIQLLTTAGGTLTGNIVLGENTAIVHDAALSADGKYDGQVRAGTAGEALAFGDLVYFKAADSRWWLADADADSTAGAVWLGMCVLAAASGGDATTILLQGFIRADTAFPTLTIGAPAYVSTTAGDVQTTQPSGTDDVIRIVGYGSSADEMFFNPSNDYITHT